MAYVQIIPRAIQQGGLLVTLNDIWGLPRHFEVMVVSESLVYP